MSLALINKNVISQNVKTKHRQTQKKKKQINKETQMNPNKQSMKKKCKI